MQANLIFPIFYIHYMSYIHIYVICQMHLLYRFFAEGVARKLMFTCSQSWAFALFFRFALRSALIFLPRIAIALSLILQTKFHTMTQLNKRERKYKYILIYSL